MVAGGGSGWTPEQLGSLEGMTYVITGATAGVGREAARILLSKGAAVVMLNRSAERSEQAAAALRAEFGPGADVRSILVDLADMSSVRRGAAAALEAVPRIDALVCNAAIAQVPSRTLTADGHESQLATNHYGHFLLCGLLFGRVEASSGRIVVVSSLGYNMGMRAINFDDMDWEEGYSPNTAYCQSKLAQMMFAFELQDRLERAGRTAVKVYVCHPGASSTSLIQTNGSMVVRLVFGLMALTPMVQSAERGAYPEVMCAAAGVEEEGLEQRALYGPTGRMEFVGPVGKGTLQPHAYEKEAMVKLWARSEEATGFTWDV